MEDFNAEGQSRDQGGARKGREEIFSFFVMTV